MYIYIYVIYIYIYTYNNHIFFRILQEDFNQFTCLPNQLVCLVDVVSAFDNITKFGGYFAI